VRSSSARLRSAASPGSTVISRSPRDKRTRPSMTKNQLGGSELEEWMTLSFGEVILRGVVNAYPVSAQKGDGRPHARAEQSAHEVKLAVRLERAPKNRCRFIGWDLDGVNWTATAARMDDGRLAGRPKVSGPAGRSIARLDVPASIEVEHPDRRRSLNTRPATPHDQEDVRGTRRHPGGDHPTGEWVGQAEEPCRDPFAEVGPRARRTINCHRLSPSPPKRRLEVAHGLVYVRWLERSRMDGPQGL
jgi:hypothetical protein